MATPNAKNVAVGMLDQQIGLRGAVHRAYDVSKMPLESQERPIELDASFTSRGLISEDGITQNLEVEETEIKEHNGQTVKVLATSKKTTLTYNYLDFYNKENLEDLFGEGNVSATEIGGNTTLNVYMTGETLPPMPTVIKFIDGDRHMLMCIPQAQVSVADGFEMSFKAGEAIQIPITITCLPYAVEGPNGVKKEVSLYYLTNKPKPTNKEKKVQLPKEEK